MADCLGNLASDELIAAEGELQACAALPPKRICCTAIPDFHNIA